MSRTNEVHFTNAVLATVDQPVNKNQVGVYVGTTGNLIVRFQKGGNLVTFTAVQAGTFISMQIYEATTVTAGTLILYA